MSLQIESISSASKMMAGQYIVCWTADPDDEPPPTSERSLAKFMSMSPCMVKTVHQNGRIRIPCQTTQKWYYVDGNEDKDCEYGKVWFAVAAPLANVTGASSASIMLRLKWTLEFQMPALPPDAAPETTLIYASAGNYFTDSSSDWKAGKYLTFKWHEGGNIVSFPSGQAKKPYKCTSNVGYYDSAGTLKQTQWAVCVTEQTEDTLPMLAPVKDKGAAMSWCKSPADNLLITYYAAGPWVTPENPPWFEQDVSLELLLSRGVSFNSAVKSEAVVKVSDNSSANTLRVLKELIGKEKITPDLVLALRNLARLSFTDIGPIDALSTFNYDPVRAGSSTSSFEHVPETDLE